MVRNETVAGAPKKNAAGKAPSSKGNGDPATAGNSDKRKNKDTIVQVRMYRALLGDAFLIRLPRSGRDAFMLIDCGIFLNADAGGKQMKRIASSIAETTGNRLDVLVVTHEHWDHLSGFQDAKEILDGIDIEELWLAWTEDGGDEVAQELRRQRRGARDTLVQVRKHMAAAAEKSCFEEYEEEGQEGVPMSGAASLDNVLNFIGEVETLGVARARRLKSGEILDGLKHKARRVRFLSPGTDPLELPGDAGVRSYVLGPPRDPSLLKRSNPTARGREVYELNQDAQAQGAYLIAARNLDGEIRPNSDDARAFRLSQPFDERHARPLKLGRRPRKGSKLNAVRDLYDDEENAWRRIDQDWLGVAEQLALKLDSDTNNTSLVLALELGEAGDVLLFPGDAQVGNWLSWAGYTWPRGAKPDDPNAVTSDQLLARTVLYKVGHHGSHNATLRTRGLELMTHRDLVAMMPVDERFAREVKDWDMPFQSLLDRLTERTRGRVLRADREVADTWHHCKDRLSPREFADFKSRSRDSREPDLYVEYDVPVRVQRA